MKRKSLLTKSSKKGEGAFIWGGEFVREYSVSCFNEFTGKSMPTVVISKCCLYGSSEEIVEEESENEASSSESDEGGNRVCHYERYLQQLAPLRHLGFLVYIQAFMFF